MDKVLSLTDLAGLSRRPSLNLKRQHSSSSPCPREESNKRQRVRSTSKPPSIPSSEKSTFTNARVSDICLSGQESSADSEAGIEELQFAFSVPENGDFDEDDKRGYSSDTNISATWTLYPNHKTESPHHCTRSSGSSSNHRLYPTSPMEGKPRTSKLFSPGNNIFDYEDPWMAVGVMLGVENTPKSPLKKRDFQKVLAEIPTPVTTPASSNDNVFGRNYNYLTPVLKDPTAQDMSLRSSSTFHSRTVPSPHKFVAGNRDAGGFQIFSPSTRSQPSLPNILHSLVPYPSDEATPTLLSSPTPSSRKHLFDLESSSEVGRQRRLNRSSTMADTTRPASDTIEQDQESEDLPLDSNRCYNDISDYHVDGVGLNDTNSSDYPGSNRSRRAGNTSSFSSPHSVFSHNQQGCLLYPRLQEQCISQFPNYSENTLRIQEVRRDEGPSSLLITPMRFADRELDHESVYARTPLSITAQQCLRTPERRTRNSAYRNKIPHNEKRTLTTRLISPTKARASPFCPVTPVTVGPDISSVEHGYYSPSMIAFHASQSNQLHNSPASSALSVHLDPRTKLSTKLDVSLHHAPARYRSLAPRSGTPTENSVRTPLNRGLPLLLPRSNVGRAAPASQHVLQSLFSKSPSSSDSPARALYRNSNENLTEEFNLQDVRPSSVQKTKIASPVSTYPIAEYKREEIERSADIRSEKLAKRAALCLNLFASDEVEPDSDD
ncbi:hypothetical protein J3R30DRAFT_2563751 [Lentinula aciculospora]|uniref:Uncharacterized protein n=1 Tax=Lentinula aciculospora TaxID=153920 RepID=A0A9W9AD27_9AGAR|nr:hypothetical protein J3R30DRAFT_2563751 [Lentinula aciculospora]